MYHILIQKRLHFNYVYNIKSVTTFKHTYIVNIFKLKFLKRTFTYEEIKIFVIVL